MILREAVCQRTFTLNSKINLEIENQIDRKTGVIYRGDDTISVPASGFPKRFWIEWEKDCKDNFNGCRWMKMWNDHLIVMQFKMQEMIDELQSNHKNEAEERKEELKMFGGGKNE